MVVYERPSMAESNNADTDGDDDSWSGGLDEIFVCREYRPVELHLGSNKNHTRPVTVNVLASPQATTDYDLTGQVLWPVSVLLSHYLVSQLSSSSTLSCDVPTTPNVVVVELGAGGTAVPSFAAAQCGGVVRQVIATDGNDHVVMELLQQNVERFRTFGECDNSSRKCLISAQQCLWGHRDHAHELLKHISSDASVLVVAADVVQWPAVVEPLLHTVKALLWSSSDPSDQNDGKSAKRITSEPDRCRSRFVLGIVNRATQTYQQFFDTAERLGFVSCPVEDLTALFDDGIIPHECSEFGGRTTELHELFLVDRTDPPILLLDSASNNSPAHQIDTDRDVMESHRHNAFVGSTYNSNTMALPC